MEPVLLWACGVLAVCALLLSGAVRCEADDLVDSQVLDDAVLQPEADAGARGPSGR